ncbi:hypothetical protein AB0M91_05330 [Micromonospora rifamycinica]|uniref:hypothetical protein n=1 Tax=Micromonospora rifamycinica TaxID=291594 RepID=UPI003418CFD8
MRPEVLIAILSAAVALVSILVTARTAHRTTVVSHELQEKTRERTRDELADELFRHYQDPLRWSAESLQSRLYNVLRCGLLPRYLRCGDPGDERYVVDNTVYVLAEYLGWVELLRRHHRFLDDNAEKNAGDLAGIIQRTHETLATDSLRGPLRLFRGQQRAIGELMLTWTESPAGRVRDVLGYARFCQLLDTDPGFRSWFGRLRAEVPAIQHSDDHGNQRLHQLHDDLLDLLDLLCREESPRPSRGRSRLAVRRR